MSKYILEASDKQLEILVKALDFYSRIQMGQVSELTNPYVIPLPDADYSDVETKVFDLKKTMFPDLDSKSYYSLNSKRLPDTVRQAVDLMETINYKISEPVEGIQSTKPFHWSSEMDLPKIKKKVD